MQGLSLLPHSHQLPPSIGQVAGQPNDPYAAAQIQMGMPARPYQFQPLPVNNSRLPLPSGGAGTSGPSAPGQLQRGRGTFHQAASNAFQQGATFLGGLGINVPSNNRSYECPICCETRPESGRILFARCGTPDHGCCRSCMAQYIRNLVIDGRVSSIGCPYCNAPASAEEILPLMDPETQTKYKRFRVMQDDPTVRECPHCGAFCPRVVDVEGGTVADMVCGTCGGEFCYFHSNAHPGRRCHDYERDITEQDMQAMKSTQVCPSCGIRTEKDGGCNHMTCRKCGQEWCWNCGAEFGTCDCNQFPDVNYRCLCCITILILPVILVFLVVAALCALTMLIYLPVTFILVYPCTGDCKMVMAISVLFASIPLWCLQIAWMVVAFPVACCCGCFGADGVMVGALLFTPILIPMSCAHMCAHAFLNRDDAYDDRALYDDDDDVVPMH